MTENRRRTSASSSQGEQSSLAASPASTSRAAVVQANADGNGSFVGASSNGVVFVQWTAESGGQISGNLYQSLTSGGQGAAEAVQTQQAAFSGVISGSNVTLSLQEGLGFTSNLVGTLRGGEFDLNYPGQNGGIVTIAMHQGTSADYNSQLSALRAQVDAANQQAAIQAQQQQNAQNATAAAQAVVGALSQLQTDEAQASSGGGGSAAVDLAQTRRDLATTLADEKNVLNEASNPSLAPGQCGADAGRVGADAGSVAADLGAVQADQGSTQTTTATIQGDVNSLKQALGALDAIRSQDPTLVPASTPTDGIAGPVIAAAQAKVNTLTAASASAVAQARRMADTAQTYSDAAQKACP
jgi:hypothetical protein